MPGVSCSARKFRPFACRREAVRARAGRFRALSQPGQGITAALSPIDGKPCLAHAFATPTTRYWTDLPPTSSSMMIYREINASNKRGLRYAQIDVGFHCFVCAREACSDRRQPYQSL